MPPGAPIGVTDSLDNNRGDRFAGQQGCQDCRMGFLVYLYWIVVCDEVGMKEWRRPVLGLFLILLFAIGAASACAGQPPTSASSIAPPGAASSLAVQNVSVSDAYALVQKNLGNANFVILDVRTPEEFQGGHLAGAVNIDFNAQDFQSKIRELDKSQQYLVYCRSGSRSAQASQYMVSQGFTHVLNMLQGITEWAAAGYPVSGQ
jgi:rhodanese-related sulfurtransferase